VKPQTDAFASANQEPVLDPRYALALSFHSPESSSEPINFLTAPNDLTDAAWTDLNTPVITSNSDTAPDGTTTADTIQDDNGTGLEAKIQSVTLLDISKAHAVSVYVKKDSTGRATRFPVFRLQFQGSTTESNDVDVDTQTGELNISNSDSDSVSADVEDYDATWWHVTIRATSNDQGNTSARILIYPARGGSATWVQNVATTRS